MNYFYIVVTAVCFCLNGVMTRVFQLKTGRRKCAIRVYQAGFCLVASAAYFFFGGGSHQPQPMTLLCALLFGLLFAVAVHFGAECYECGSMSLTSLIMNLSLSIPLVYSFIVFHESITALQGIGLALLLVTFVLSAISSDKPENDEKKRSGRVSVRWVVLLFFAFLANGLTAVIQKQHQHSVENAGGLFLAMAYLVAAIYFTVLFIIENRGEAGHKFVFSDYFSGRLRLAAVTVVSGLGSFFGNGLLNSLSVTVDAAILYPSVNGGLAILTAVVSFALFKEKVGALKLISILIGVCAIVMLAV